MLIIGSDSFCLLRRITFVHLLRWPPAVQKKIDAALLPCASHSLLEVYTLAENTVKLPDLIFNFCTVITVKVGLKN